MITHLVSLRFPITKVFIYDQVYWYTVDAPNEKKKIIQFLMPDGENELIKIDQGTE